MPLDPSDVLKVAKLAKLKIAEKDIPAMATELSRIVEMMAELSAIDTSGVEPLTHPMDFGNRTQPDVSKASLPRDAVLCNSPDHDEQYFRVPKVL